jgi:hypothetical protein
VLRYSVALQNTKTPDSTPPLQNGTISLTQYIRGVVPLETAQMMYQFSRTVFYRFRVRHGIVTLPGDKVSLVDIAEAFEAERSFGSGSCRTAPSPVTLEDALVYHAKLFRLNKVQSACGISRSVFWRLRDKHGISKLSGRLVHEADVIDALEAERQGAQHTPC